MKKTVLFIWMIIMLTSVFTPELYAVTSFEQAKKEVLDPSGQEEEKDNEGRTLNLQIDRTIASTLQLGFHADLSFEFELPLIPDSGSKKTKLTSIETIDHFKILFYYTISPNAP